MIGRFSLPLAAQGRGSLHHAAAAGNMPAFHMISMGVERAGVAHIIKLLVVNMAAAPRDCLVGRATMTIAIGQGCAQG